MQDGCTCRYCKVKVNEKFCSTCGYNFNDCESIYEFIYSEPGDLPKFGSALCPKCVNDDTIDSIKNPASSFGEFLRLKA